MTSENGFPTVARNFEDILGIIRWLRDAVLTSSANLENSFTWRVERHSFPYGIWFRGEHDGDKQKELLPGVFRQTDDGEDLVEAFINNHLQTRIPELAAVPNPFDKLCMAQHYNVPTRLLDWTENFLTAAYFAVATEDDEEKPKEDGALYVMNAYSLNAECAIGRGSGRIHMADDFGTLLRSEMAFCSSISEWLQRIANRQPVFDWKIMARDAGRATSFDVSKDEDQIAMVKLFQRPIGVMPTRSNPRMLVQASTFTLHGGCNWTDATADMKYSPLPSAVTGGRRRIWMKCRIPKECRAEIEEQLFALGIHQSTLFPELDKQRGYLVKVCRKGKLQ